MCATSVFSLGLASAFFYAYSRFALGTLRDARGTKWLTLSAAVLSLAAAAAPWLSALRGVRALLSAPDEDGARVSLFELPRPPPRHVAPVVRRTPYII